jgi:hypothetical protein
MSMKVPHGSPSIKDYVVNTPDDLLHRQTDRGLICRTYCSGKTQLSNLEKSILFTKDFDEIVPKIVQLFVIEQTGISAV